MKVYIINAYYSFTDCSTQSIEKCFLDKEKAIICLNELREDNNKALFMSYKCRECMGNDRNCPLWAECSDMDEGCENYSNYAYYENVDYELVERELVE